MRAYLGRKLRDLADRIDQKNAVVCFMGYWNHTKNGVTVTVTDGIMGDPPGCPLLYVASDYELAWSRFYDKEN